MAVERRIVKDASATGGHFSTCYEVSKDGRRAFLKAIDIHGMLEANPGRMIDVMHHVSQAYIHERELLASYCQMLWMTWRENAQAATSSSIV